jgi:photosystem II stability/assembly factor-like uncharacterized protein
VRRVLALLAALAAVASAGCGGESSGSSSEQPDEQRSGRLVDLSLNPPYVNGLDVDPKTGDYLLTTNKGFWRIDANTDEVTQVEGTVSSGGAESPVGTFLFVHAREDGTLIGSGHPDQPTLPQYLGLIESSDGGLNWTVVSRLGEADLHKIVETHDRLYAWDAVLSALLVSSDGGRNFKESFTPRGLIIDFAVDPKDPDVIVAANEDQIFRTEDGGQAWRPLSGAEGVRLAWTAPDKLYRADKDGRVYVSPDGGQRFDQVGEIQGEPYKIEPVGPDELLVALSDGSIVKTVDGAKTWSDEFRP